MNSDFWKQFTHVPRIDCVKMKHDIQRRIYLDTLGMTPEERSAYRLRRVSAFRASEKPQSLNEPALLVLREDPPKSR